MLIPDLQRPYVWTPNQVTLLVDSLVRGWPFGTLLLWKISSEEFQGIPFRCFWNVVDRTPEPNHSSVSHLNPPAEFHMVLDGQQRVQSLLLAVGGDSWGFRLTDRDWTEELKGIRPRGRQPKYPHWSMATLCFDLVAFMKEYEANGQSFTAIDFRKVLVWAVTDPQNGLSTYPRPEGYEGPVTKSFAPENYGRYIRFARLWQAATPNPGLKEAQFRAIINPVLEQHGVPANRVQALLSPMGELMTTLRDVKLADVTYLELQPFDEATSTRESYNDAIVNIFTRLNTAGRTLTREEITLAWLKVGWEPQYTQNKTAGECFTALRATLADLGLELAMDELVSVASFLWAVHDRDGKLLNNSDLLKGEVVRPMAAKLSQHWDAVCTALLTTAHLLLKHQLSYGPGGHFLSLYALAIPCAWLYTAERWRSSRSLTVTERDSFEKQCRHAIETSLNRWIFGSQWAGRWAASSDTTIAAYTRSLSTRASECSGATTIADVISVLTNYMEELVTDLTTDASAHLETAFLSVPRQQINVYKNFLWLWHRLDAERWRMSQIQLRIGKTAPSLEVDHTVAVSLWIDMVDNQEPESMAAAIDVVNRLGNCSLLEKNFNISKGKAPMKDFLLKVHEFKSGEVKLDDWAKALCVPAAMLDPVSSGVDEVAKAIDARDAGIRSELIAFVTGDKTRVDVE